MAVHDPAADRARAQARLRRGMYLLPSLFTVGNIAAGYFAITQTIAAIGSNSDARLHLDWAAIAILFAIPFDALDGRIARMTNTTSEFGKELDSLADVITFGVAPACWPISGVSISFPNRSTISCGRTCFMPEPLSAFFISLAARPGWPASTSATMLSRVIPGGRGESTSSACQFRLRQGCWPLRCISLQPIPIRPGGWRSSGWSSSAPADSSWSAPGASGRGKKSISPAAIHFRSYWSWLSSCS